MRAIRLHRRALTSCVALLASMTVGMLCIGCSYLLGDPYPNYFQRAVAWVDLDKTIRDAGISSPRYILKVNLLQSPVYGDHVFAVVNASGSTSILALNAKDLSLEKYLDPVTFQGLGQGMFVSVAGSFRLGAEAVTTSPSFAGTDYSLLNQYADLPGYCDGASNVIVSGSSGTNLAYSFTPPATLTSTPVTLGSASGQFIDAAYFASSAAPVKLLVSQGNQVYYFGYSSTSTLATGPSESASLSTNGNGGGTGAGLTAGGLVVVVSQQNNVYHIERVEYSTSRVLDSYDAQVNGNSSFWFEPSGRYWFLYEGSSGRLFELRTWW